MISSDRISVVVQGPVVGGPQEAPDKRLTDACLTSVRQHLPKAEIVLSTWKGTDISNLDFDVLIESEDPGALFFAGNAKLRNNVNRQIISSQNGLQATTRPYALKLRSDMIVRSTNFLSFFEKFGVRSDWSMLRSKVVASTLYSRIPGLLGQWPYHPGDWYFFGLKDDVLDIWDIPSAPEPETTLWFVNQPRPRNDVDPTCMNRYTPEQYIWLTFLRKHMDVRCDYQWDLDAKAIEGTERTFASNLVLISPKQAGLSFEKYPTYTGFSTWLHGPGNCYDHRYWQYLYEKHCTHTRSRVGWSAALRWAVATCGIFALHKYAAAQARLRRLNALASKASLL